MKKHRLLLSLIPVLLYLLHSQEATQKLKQVAETVYTPAGLCAGVFLFVLLILAGASAVFIIESYFKDTVKEKFVSAFYFFSSLIVASLEGSAGLLFAAAFLILKL
jgi:hypothetical protein